MQVRAISERAFKMIKLIGKDILNRNVIVECEDKNAVARTKRAYAKAGIALSSYDAYVKREAKRLLDPRENGE